MTLLSQFDKLLGIQESCIDPHNFYMEISTFATKFWHLFKIERKYLIEAKLCDPYCSDDIDEISDSIITSISSRNFNRRGLNWQSVMYLILLFDEWIAEDSYTVDFKKWIGILNDTAANYKIILENDIPDVMIR